MAAKMIEVEVISREIIKPSSPTPSHLRHYQLSFLDQTAPPVYMGPVLFYPRDNTGKTKLNSEDISIRLKASLSDTLGRYYPLAGRLKNDFTVECNDEGVPYLETRVGCCLSDVIQDADPMQLHKFAPFLLRAHNDVLLGIQFNVFKCGGIALGVCISHLVADGLSLVMFGGIWCAIYHGEENILAPEFVSAKLFPPEKITLDSLHPGMRTTTDAETKAENNAIITKRFVFGTNSIKALKTKCAPGKDTHTSLQPTRFEALSAFIWNRIAASTRPEGGNCFMVHPVNLRTKFEPPLPDHSFGNLACQGTTLLTPNFGNASDLLIPRMRKAIRKFDGELIERLRAWDGHQSIIKRMSEMYNKGQENIYTFVSWGGIPIYQADLGWGKPAWVGLPLGTFNNYVLFMETKSGDGGMEAYISLKKEDMEKFEKDEELQSYVLFSKMSRL